MLVTPRFLAVLVVVLSLPATALAGTLPPPGLEAGGGGFGTHGHHGIGDRLIGLKVGPDGRTVQITGTFAASCGKALQLRGFRATAAIGDDGSFAVDAPTSQTLNIPLKGHAQVHVAGSFDGPRASGTLNFTPGSKLTYKISHSKPNKKPAKPCLTTAAPFQARDPGRPSGRTGTVVPSQSLFGLSSARNHGVRIGAIAETTASGRVREVYVYGRMHCTSEPDYLGNYTSPPIKVKASGAFRIVERYPLLYSNATSHYRVTTTGQFAASGGLLGRMAVSVKTRFNDGDLQRCAHASSTEYAVVP